MKQLHLGLRSPRNLAKRRQYDDPAHSLISLPLHKRFLFHCHAVTLHAAPCLRKVDQIKSPPEFAPCRKDQRRDRAGRRNPPRPTVNGNVRHRGEGYEESKGSPCVASPILEEDSPLDGRELPISDEGEAVEEGNGYGSDLRGAAGDESVGKAEMYWREREVVRVGKMDELDGAKSLEDQGTSSALLTPIRGASADDHEPVQAKSHPRSKLLSAAAAIDKAAAVFAAIPKVRVFVAS